MARDISMAKAAGVTAVWARYGTQSERGLWEILVRVTHWTEKDVQRAGELRQLTRDVSPDYVIDDFGELLNLISSALNTAGDLRVAR